MQLHIGHEAVTAFALSRADEPDAKARSAGLSQKSALRGIPPEAWAYKLGNRSAIEEVLDQYKEKKPKDPTIREKFDSYRFADYKDKVIDLLMRVTTVSVETMQVVNAMKGLSRQADRPHENPSVGLLRAAKPI